MVKAPRSLRAEHDEMRRFVTRLAREGGATADAAERLSRVLEVHFSKEESFAAPPLGLLPRLARGDFDTGMANALAHSDWLRQNITTMLAEHRLIAAAVEELLRAAGPQTPPELVAFAETLLNHSRFEEEVLYPAAIVAGEYLKMRLAERVAIAAL
jgi:DNA-binding PucR family transcriptional regulator